MVPDERLRDQATSVVLRNLLPQFAKGDSAISAGDLAGLTERIGNLSSPVGTQLADVADKTLETMPWSEAGADEDIREGLWERKRRFYATLLVLAPDTTPATTIGTLIIDDLCGALDAYDLDDPTVTTFAEVCGELPTGLVAEVSDRIDVMDVPAGLEAFALRLRLLVRRSFGGQALAVSDLLALDESLRATPISGAWLALRPSVCDVIDVLGEFPFTPTALGEYSGLLSLDDRTELWVKAVQASLADQLIEAIGKPGVGAGAVEYIRQSVEGLAREPERSKKIRRLRLAEPAAGSDSSAVQKSAGVLARELMSNNAAGDVRSAAQLMCWARGAFSRNRVELRTLFDEQVKAHKNALTKSLFVDMENLGLVSKKKSLRELIFGSGVSS